jgi:hypothetical protein
MQNAYNKDSSQQMQQEIYFGSFITLGTESVVSCLVSNDKNGTLKKKKINSGW